MEDFTITHIGDTALCLPMPFKFIPAKGKTFMFQADDGSNLGNKNEGTPITFENDFWMCAYPTTQEFWSKVLHISGIKDLNPNPSNFKGKTRPVEQVSWDDVQLFNKALNSLFINQGLKVEEKPKIIGEFVLPNETQWEYAACAEQNTVFSGSDHLQDVAWYAENSNNQTMPVGLKQANGFGLYDMSGNVWEFCYNHFENEIEVISKRGGGSFVRKEFCKITFRSNDNLTDRFSNFGFRIVFW